ncbi:MAG: type II secretion system protein [Planctomycetota bacterium]|jgi:prepilin-type N-terminal cleavage/methylation domain-containing protein|nr:type II secretion system protein [Planctomycetota bacterium]
MVSKTSRPAFTLIELLLVLSILVAALAVVAPNIEGMLTARAVQTGVEAVRVELQKARIEAIRTGQIQAFRCQVGSKEYAVESWLSASDETEASVGATIISQTGQALETSAGATGVSASIDDTPVGQKSLDGNVVFADLQIASDRRSIAEQTGSDPLALAASGAPQAILLYPDGSSSTAHIVVQDARGRRMAVQLRGLTGQVEVIEMPSVAPGT